MLSIWWPVRHAPVRQGCVVTNMVAGGGAEALSSEAQAGTSPPMRTTTSGKSKKQRISIINIVHQAFNGIFPCECSLVSMLRPYSLIS